MGKVINVDFKNKRKEFTWDDNTEENQAVLKALDQVFGDSIFVIMQLSPKDTEYHNYCARVLKGIILNLKNR